MLLGGNKFSGETEARKRQRKCQGFLGSVEEWHGCWVLKDAAGFCIEGSLKKGAAESERIVGFYCNIPGKRWWWYWLPPELSQWWKVIGFCYSLEVEPTRAFADGRNVGCEREWVVKEWQTDGSLPLTTVQGGEKWVCVGDGWTSYLICLEP